MLGATVERSSIFGSSRCVHSAILLGKDVIGVVDGTDLQPAATAPANMRSEWQKKDNIAISLLCDAISKSYH